jgi:chromosome segregation protein
LKEGSVLVGVGILEYKNFKPEGGDGEGSRDKQESRRKEIEKIKIRLEDAGSGSGEDVLKEFEETRDRDAFLEKELADLEASAGSLKIMIAELGEKLETEFAGGVKKINIEFQNFFSRMFGGGTANLGLVKKVKRKRSDTDTMLGLDDDEARALMEEEQEEESGVDISISLPRKKIRGLDMLSGGERALTSIALIFAMSRVNPPPFIILDETDAALDEANSRKYGDMIGSLSKYSQLILVTHNRETMSRAGIIYGVTMGVDGISKLLSIQFEEAVQVAK